MGNFVFRGVKGEIENVNGRAEFEGDDKSLACDVKVRCTVPIAALDTLCGSVDRVGMSQALVRQDGEHNLAVGPRYYQLESLSLATELEECTLHVGNRLVQCDKAKKFVVDHITGSEVRLVFTAQVRHVKDKDLTFLYDSLKESVPLGLELGADLFSEEATGTSADPVAAG